MKSQRMAAVLEKLLDQDWAVFIWGAPGIGKSSLVRQTGEKLGLPVTDLRASLLDPTDLRGIPAVEKGRARWCPPAFLPAPDAKPGILFLDEINAAPPLVQASLYQLVLDRQVGEYVLPKGWKIIAAGNRRTDRAVTFRMSSALSNRFIHLTLEADATSWQSWAAGAGIHPLVTAFLRLKPKLLWHADESSEEAFASPRSWHMLSDVLKRFGSHSEIRDFTSGIVGQSVAAEFHAFCRGAMTEADIRAILADPEHAPIPAELDRKWTLISWLTAMPDESSDAAGILLDRLEPEFAVVLARGMLTARPAFFANRHFQAFMADHTDVFGG